jgi:hypothetical protein
MKRLAFARVSESLAILVALRVDRYDSFVVITASAARNASLSAARRPNVEGTTPFVLGFARQNA